MTVVVDASLAVAALVGNRADGGWARELLVANALVAPQIMMAEAANILRRLQLRGEISRDVASLAHIDLLELPVGLVAYQTFAARTWELRDNLSIYDASYVAVAESLGVPLATLDLRMMNAPGPRCEFLVPPIA